MEYHFLQNSILEVINMCGTAFEIEQINKIMNMKRLFWIFAAASTLILGSCNEELGPEYTTMPELKDFAITPNLIPENNGDKVEVEAGQRIMFTGYMSNQYGESNVYVTYRTAETDMIGTAGEKWSTWQTPKKEDFTLFRWDIFPITMQPFTLYLPAQKSGTTVEWRFCYANVYGLGGDTGVLTYSVKGMSINPEDGLE